MESIGLRPQPERVHMDELFIAERDADAAKQVVHQQVLARVHKRIRVAARNYKQGHNCWYVIPEVMLGIPRYDVSECTQYLMDTLERNGFRVRYTHPNLLFVSWAHYLHAGKREAIRRSTGKAVDGLGRDADHARTGVQAQASRTGVQAQASRTVGFKPEPEYRPISTYAPTGVYGTALTNDAVMQLR